MIGERREPTPGDWLQNRETPDQQAPRDRHRDLGQRERARRIADTLRQRAASRPPIAMPSMNA